MALILSRKLGEALIIRGDITVQVVDIRGGKIRLGITAPKEVAVNRSEVQAAIDAERTSGKRPAPADAEVGDS